MRNSPVSASTAVMTSGRAGHSVLTSRDPMTSSRSCSDGVRPAFSAASASAPIRRRNSTSFPRLRSIAQPNWARVAGLSRAAFSAVAGSSCRWYIASNPAPQVSCAPTTDPADVPTTRSAPLRSDARLGKPRQQPDLPRDAGDAPAAEDEGGALIAHGSHLHRHPDVSRQGV